MWTAVTKLGKKYLIAGLLTSYRFTGTFNMQNLTRS